ncbi:PTS sugar transporter subunit IIA [Virgibacillus sp. LDC-1]|uniref:PTS sugar transporter subunit IIA n=1 Tax=Virgibacillus sp. LDC-1 TaxID=3039856 RepID=UPI0024DE5CE7|nr:PTS sugar transporter subunit IIA [Virgibacillus sp. LDC-1]
MSLLREEAVLLDAEVSDAVEAILLSGDLLVKAGYASEEYTYAMIEGFQNVGPYIVIAPGIAIPHSRPERGAIATGFSLLRLKKPIEFGHEKNDPVNLVCAITGIGNNGHVEMLQKIATVLGDQRTHEQILKASNYTELSKIITI